MSRENAEVVIVRLIETGDYRTALERSMDLYGETVYRFCLRVVKDVNVAEDVRQKTFVLAHRGLPKFAGESSLRTWLLGIAKNQSIDALRASKREAGRLLPDDELLADAIEGGPSPGERFEGEFAKDVLAACLDECVSAEEKFLILLHFVEELSYEEMAATLGKKADTLRARVTRTFPKLRRCLEHKGAKP